MNQPAVPHVTVVLATRNPRPGWLSSSIDSVLSQSYPHLDLVVLDDGSQPAVTTRADPRLTLLRLTDSVGVSAARNIGIAHSCGDMVAFIDDDDTWSHDKLERQVLILSKNPDVVLVATDFDWLDGASQRFGTGYRGYWADRHELLQGCGLLLSSVVVRRDALARTGGFDSTLRVCEDWDLFLKLTATGKFDRVGEPLTHYRWHDDNGRRVEETAAVSFALLDKYEAILSSQGDLAGLQSLSDGRRRMRTMFAHQSLTRARTTHKERGWKAAAPSVVASIKLDWRVVTRAVIQRVGATRT